MGAFPVKSVLVRRNISFFTSSTPRKGVITVNLLLYTLPPIRTGFWSAHLNIPKPVSAIGEVYYLPLFSKCTI